MNTMTEQQPTYNLEPEKAMFFKDVCDHLSLSQKTLPCKYLYDETGSHLFNAITQTEEYYVTRTELNIMRQYCREVAALMGEQCLLIEYGSGNGEKVRLLLNHLVKPVGYAPIDISKDHLQKTANELHKEYPQLEILSICADFTKLLPLAIPDRDIKKKLIYFPGSTIGNFHQDEVKALLRKMRLSLNNHDGLLIGIDLKKDPDIIYRAYNDAAGYTAAFNRNILVRINRELEGTFQPDWFEHRAIYNPEKSRMEMHLISRYDHSANVLDQRFFFHQGEGIHTECSYKYNLDEFSTLAEDAGFQLQKYWTDQNSYFGVLYLSVKPFKIV